MKLVVVPAVPALLPEHAGITDPVAELRGSCAAAVSWLLDPTPGQVAVVGERSHALSTRIGTSLLRQAGHRDDPLPAPTAGTDALVLVANGSARRGEKAPGHLDERAFDFDHTVGAALKTGDLDALADLDLRLGEELWTAGLDELRAVAGALSSWRTVEMLYDDDPFGVQYWVVTAQCES